MHAMNDTMGLTYDDQAAVFFAHKSTGLDESVVAAVLRSRDHYLLGLGILPADETALEAPRAIRDAHRDLFPAAHVQLRYVDQAMECAFVVQDSGINDVTVRLVLKADEEYMRKCGIID